MLEKEDLRIMGVYELLGIGFNAVCYEYVEVRSLEVLVLSLCLSWVRGEWG
jgi:hypothetical protein